MIQFFEALLSCLVVLFVFLKYVLIPYFVKLQVILTKDLFFRLTGRGEFCFPRITLYIPLNNIRVKDVSFSIENTTSKSKSSYKCSVVAVGSVEKMDDRGVLKPQHFFNSKTTEFFYKKKHINKLCFSV